MRRVPLNIDLRGKTAIVTGGGILCGGFSEAVRVMDYMIVR